MHAAVFQYHRSASRSCRQDSLRYSVMRLQFLLQRLMYVCCLPVLEPARCENKSSQRSSISELLDHPAAYLASHVPGSLTMFRGCIDPKSRNLLCIATYMALSYLAPFFNLVVNPVSLCYIGINRTSTGNTRTLYYRNAVRLYRREAADLAYHVPDSKPL